MKITYTCSICLNINHVVRLHCSTCGTIPAMYSWSHVPSRFVADNENLHTAHISVTVATGAERQEKYHQTRSNMKTVPLDYYAS